jgi:hypothetical protein
MNYLLVRKGLYEDVYESELSKFNIDLYTWRYHPYTKLKSHYYIEIGAICVYFLLKTKVLPNYITLFYAGLGVLGFLLFTFDTAIATVFALVIFFSKSIPDWIDGHIARLTEQTSQLGGYLDEWGAIVNLLGFQLGVSVYVANHTGNDCYFIIGMVMVLLHAIDLRKYICMVSELKYISFDTQSILDASLSTLDKIRILLFKLFSILQYSGKSAYTDIVIFIISMELILNQIVFTEFIVWMWFIISLSKFFYGVITVIINDVSHHPVVLKK